MSVYKEGYSIIEDIQNGHREVYGDACDYGVPVKKGDKMWTNIQMLKEMYGPNEEFPEDGLEMHKDIFGGCFDILLMDEWAVSDGRKTEEEATEKYRVHYFKINNKKHPSIRPAFKNADGFVHVDRI